MHYKYVNGKKIDIDNLDLDHSYTLKEFELINEQLKTQPLKVDGYPVNLFDLDRNDKVYSYAAITIL